MRSLYRLIVINLLGNLLRLLLSLRPTRARWVQVSLEGPLPARPARRRWFGAAAPSLAELAGGLEELGADPRVEGLVVELHATGGAWAHAQSLRELLAGLVARGKRVVVHLSSPTLRELYIASAATQIVVDESGPIWLTGLSAEAVFWGEALGRVGVRAQTEFRGAYKSMGEMFSRADMSPAHREALDAVLDGVHAEITAAIAAGRRLARDRATELIEGGPYTAAEAARLGLVDKVAYADELPEWLQAGKPMPLRTWRRRRAWRPRWRPLVDPPEIAVVPLHGVIVGGEGSGRSLGSKAAVRTLASLREHRRTAAVVLHIDSRGGGAAASDLIWREVKRLAATKPVVAYMHDVAASGGYYIACAATRIVAQPATLTGSIGVVAGKLSFAGLLEKVGLHAVVLRRGAASAMLRASVDYSEEERRRLRAELDAMYGQFVTKVAAGRSLDPDAAEASAQGRVWLGADARPRGLVDELGPVEAALRLARSLAGEVGARARVVERPLAVRRRTLLARLTAPAAVEELLALEREGPLFLAASVTLR